MTTRVKYYQILQYPAAGMSDDVIATEGPPREVRRERPTARGPAWGALSRRRFDAPIEDVWQLFADPERLRLWYPDSITGDFRLGGEFKIEHNASGRILRCEPPRRFRVSWIYEDSCSELDVRLGPVGNGATVVEFEHLMGGGGTYRRGHEPERRLVAGGVGWDLSLEYLGGYLRGQFAGPPTGEGAFAAEDEKRYRRSERLWQEVVGETPLPRQDETLAR